MNAVRNGLSGLHMAKHHPQQSPWHAHKAQTTHVTLNFDL